MGERFKLDENLPHQVRTLLTDLGHDAETVHEERLVGEPDSAILQACIAERRILVTLDLDFSDIRQSPPLATPASGYSALAPRVSAIRYLHCGAPLPLSASKQPPPVSG